ncbi:hypothetical protein, partial [uncultured Desulfovibrio sp.]|uniref:hypothetical protein n=1 Tax=uncultured Desulfovibrio sp. TaxID=167968 RepID=UPI0026705C62
VFERALGKRPKKEKAVNSENAREAPRGVFRRQDGCKAGKEEIAPLCPFKNVFEHMRRGKLRSLTF